MHGKGIVLISILPINTEAAYISQHAIHSPDTKMSRLAPVMSRTLSS